MVQIIEKYFLLGVDNYVHLLCFTSTCPNSCICFLFVFYLARTACVSWCKSALYHSVCGNKSPEMRWHYRFTSILLHHIHALKNFVSLKKTWDGTWVLIGLSMFSAIFKKYFSYRIRVRLWCLTSLSTLFNYIMAVSFIGGGNRSTRRKYYLSYIGSVSVLIEELTE